MPTQTFTSAHVTVSLDGFMAGPGQTLEHPMGRGAIEMHRWHFGELNEVDQRWADRLLRPRGAVVMGRNMYGPVRGPWDAWQGEEWRGWWGEEPPYHAPVFVLTHHAHEPIEMEGGTTFHFVTDGFDAALELAREAGGGDVAIAGGVSTVRQALAAGVLDELTLEIAPLLVGEGERIFDGTVTPTLEIVEAEHSPLATHVRYRVVR